MIWPALALLAVGFVLSLVLTASVRALARRVGFVDKPGGRKVHEKVTPLGGGVAIFWAVALPLLAVLALPWMMPAEHAWADYVGGITLQTPLLLKVLAAVGAMHIVGLVDDRRALGPYTKLVLQLGVASALVATTDLRVLTAAGPVVSAVLTVIWITAITNAFNFLDNMDGLSAGIAAVASAAFLVTALSIGQVFVAATLALLLGACLGFLVFNFAPASIFMGDSGSLVLGFLLAVLTVRTTYLPPGEELVSAWYTVFTPVLVLAVPLYDLVVVSALRMSRGRSPFRGDTNHFSHRLVRRGMSKVQAVLCIYLLTGTTAAAAVVLPHVHSAFAACVLFGQTVMTLGVVYLLERGEGLVVFSDPEPGKAAGDSTWSRLSGGSEGGGGT